MSVFGVPEPRAVSSPPVCPLAVVNGTGASDLALKALVLAVWPAVDALHGQLLTGKRVKGSE